MKKSSFLLTLLGSFWGRRHITTLAILKTSSIQLNFKRRKVVLGKVVAVLCKYSQNVQNCNDQKSIFMKGLEQTGADWNTPGGHLCNEPGL